MRERNGSRRLAPPVTLVPAPQPASTTPERQTYTVEEVAALFGRHHNVVYRVVKETGAWCGVPALRPTPRTILFPKRAIDQLLTTGRIEASA